MLQVILKLIIYEIEIILFGNLNLHLMKIFKYSKVFEILFFFSNFSSNLDPKRLKFFFNNRLLVLK